MTNFGSTFFPSALNQFIAGGFSGGLSRLPVFGLDYPPSVVTFDE